MQLPTAPRADDTGGIVVGWLVKLVAVFAVVGVLAFDGVSVGAAELTVTDTAVAAARAAGVELSTGATAQQAYLAAYDAAVQDDALNEVPAESFLVGADRSVSLLVRRTPPTMVLHHIPRSDGWLVAEAYATRAAGSSSDPGFGSAAP